MNDLAPNQHGSSGPHRAPDRNAPQSPRIKQWNKRVLAWGCAPAMIGGLLVPVAAVASQWGMGASLVIAPLLFLYAYHLRRDNQSRYDAARKKAMQEGMVLRPAELESGDMEYRLVSQAELDRERWGDDLDRWSEQQAEPEDG